MCILQYLTNRAACLKRIGGFATASTLADEVRGSMFVFQDVGEYTQKTLDGTPNCPKSDGNFLADECSDQLSCFLMPDLGFLEKEVESDKRSRRDAGNCC